jgi:hypothetical protein
MSRALKRDVIARVNAFLRNELAAVAGYQKALRALRLRATADGEQMLQLAADHQRTVTALHGYLQSRGESPALDGEPWAVLGAAVLDGNGGAPPRIRDRELLSALLEVERQALADYELALPSLDAEARELVELELIPRQKKHVTGLSQRLVQLAS